MKTFSILVILLLCGNMSIAADGINENPLKVLSVKLSEKNIPSGTNSTLLLDLSLDHGNKAYVDMFKIRWKYPENLKTAMIVPEKSFKFEDKFTKKIREGVKGTVRLTALIETPIHLPAGDYKGVVEFIYQVCTESYCLLPQTLILNVPFTAIASTGDLLVADNDTPPTNSISEVFRHGTIYAFLFVFFAGILTSLTPCIFPMIPITLAIIGARASEQKKFKSFTLSLFYVLGIAFTYSALGMLAARTGAVFGSYLGHPLVVGFISIVFFAMALSMYGLYEIQMPHFITKKLNKKVEAANYLGAFVTGLITGIVASPCVGPVLVSLLAYVAQTQNIFFGFSLLFTFALGIGQLFLILGTFGGMLQRLPKSGPWMEFVKFMFGTTMIAAAIYYLHPILSDLMLLSFGTLTETLKIMVCVRDH